MNDSATPGRFGNQSLRQLQAELDWIAEVERGNKALKAEINDEIERRLGSELAAALAAKGKDTGTATVPTADGGTAKRTVKKHVSYDNAALTAIAAGMPWETANALFKITVNLPEANYAGLAANPSLKAKIDAARTVEPKPDAIKLQFPEAAS